MSFPTQKLVSFDFKCPLFKNYNHSNYRFLNLLGVIFEGGTLREHFNLFHMIKGLFFSNAGVPALALVIVSILSYWEITGKL